MRERERERERVTGNWVCVEIISLYLTADLITALSGVKSNDREKEGMESGENGIRTNVYFKQVARARNKEKGKEGLAEVGEEGQGWCNLRRCEAKG